MIYDCFPFYNELDILEIKLNTLYDVVDYFVLVEATTTHTGVIKPLYYEYNRYAYPERFARFKSKIIHVLVQNMPITENEVLAAISTEDRQWLATGYQLGDDWVRERFQRNEMMRVLQHCDPNDIIIIEDADEIVRPEILANIENIIVDGSNAVEQTLHTYYLNFKCTNMPWWGSKILRKKFVTNPSEHRFHTPAANYIRDGGWHFNFMGGTKAIQQKIKSYSHQEFNVPEVLNNIDIRLKEKKDALGRLYQYEVVPITADHYPKYIVDNINLYSNWIYKE